MSTFDFERCRLSIKSWIDSDTRVSEAISFIDKYAFNVALTAIVVNKNNGGVVCRVGNDGAKGFLTTTDIQYGLDSSTYNKIATGDTLSCEIFAFDNNHNSFQLKFVEILNHPSIE